jgi:hypothetical protein
MTEYTVKELFRTYLDVYFISPAPVYGFLGAQASSPFRKQARRLRSQGIAFLNVA